MNGSKPCRKGEELDLSDDELKVKVRQLAGGAFELFAEEYAAAIHRAIAGRNDASAVPLRFRETIDQLEARGWEVKKPCEVLSRMVLILLNISLSCCDLVCPQVRDRATVTAGIDPRSCYLAELLRRFVLRLELSSSSSLESASGPVASEGSSIQ